MLLEILKDKIFLTSGANYLFLLRKLHQVSRSIDKRRLLGETIRTLVFEDKSCGQTRLAHYFLTSKTFNG